MIDLFEKYSFRLGKITVSDKGIITVSFLIFAKDKAARLAIQKCSIRDTNGQTTTFIPKDNIVGLEKRESKRFSFSFPSVEIKRYSYGANIEIVILDEINESKVTICYAYTKELGWSLSDVTDSYAPSDMENDDVVDSRQLSIDNMNFSIRTYNCLYRAGIRNLGELMDKTMEDVKLIRNIGEKTLEEILEKIGEYGVRLKGDNVEVNHLNDFEERTFSEKVETTKGYKFKSSVERIKEETKLKEIEFEEINGFCCHYCTMLEGNDGYILVEQIDVDLAEFVENELAWNKFQEKVFRTFNSKTHCPGIIYMILLIHKGNANIPIQKIEGSRKFGRKYVFTEEEAINFISGFNYNFELDKNLNPVEFWFQQLNPIRLTGIITYPYYAKYVDNYLNGEPFEDLSLLELSKKGYDNSVVTTEVERITSVQMGDFREFCFGNSKQMNFGDINLLFGANGSGKTSILEAIEYGFTAEIHRMKDFKIKYGDDKYPRIVTANNQGKQTVFEPSSSKKNAKNIEKVWYGVPIGRTKTTLNEQFNRFNYFDSEAAYKFIHAKDQNNDMFEGLFSNLLFGEIIVGYEKKWKRFKKAFEEADSRIREELNNAEFWYGVYKDALEMTNSNIDVTPIYAEAERIHLVNSYDRTTVPLDRLIKIKQELAFVETAVRNFQNTIYFEPGVTVNGIKKMVEERKLENDQFQDHLNQRKNEIEQFVTQKNQIADKILSLYVEEETLGGKIEQYEETYGLYLQLKKVLDHPEKVREIEQYEADLENILEECDIASMLKNNMRIQVLLNEADVDVLIPEVRDYYEKKLVEKKRKFLVLKDEYEHIKTFNTEKNNDIIELQELGMRFLQKYDAEICPLCGEEYRDKQELLQHIEKISLLEADNTQLVSKIGCFEEEIDRLQRILQRDDTLMQAYEELTRKVPKTERMPDKGVTYIRELVNKRSNLLSQEKELKHSIEFLKNQGYDYSMITKAKNFAQQNSIYARYLEQSNQSFKAFCDFEISKITLQVEKIKETIEKLKFEQRQIVIKIDSEKRNLDLFRTSDIPSKYIEARNLYQMLMPIKEKFDIEDSTDLKQWVVDYDRLVQNIDFYINQINEYSDIEYEKQQAKEYKKIIRSLKKQSNRCKMAMDVLNRMPSLKTFVIDTVESNIQRISYYFRWMHHSGEFEHLGIDAIGIYAIRGVDNKKVRIYEMSTGQRTSLAFSVMLAFYSVADMAPKCLLLDEPLATMDNVQVGNALDILKSLAKQGTQIFFTSASQDTINMFRNAFKNTGFDYREFEFVKRINGTVKINGDKS